MLISSIYSAVAFVERNGKRRKTKRKKKRVNASAKPFCKPLETKAKRPKQKKKRRRKTGGDFLNGSNVVRGFR